MPTPVIVSLDVQYRAEGGHAAVLAFAGWESTAILERKVVIVPNERIGDYKPGAFFQRELPCLLAAIDKLEISFQFVLIDGYVWLGENHSPGLGAKLYDALQRRAPVIGVAKTRYRGAPAEEIVRGESRQPLFVSSVGIPSSEAAECIKRMHGHYRLPTMIRMTDQLARQQTKATTKDC